MLRIPHFLTFFKSHILFSTFRPILVDFSIYSGDTIWVKASWNTRMHIVSQMTSCLIDFNFSYYSLKFKTWVGFLKFLIHNFQHYIGFWSNTFEQTKTTDNQWSQWVSERPNIYSSIYIVPAREVQRSRDESQRSRSQGAGDSAHR